MATLQSSTARSRAIAFTGCRNSFNLTCQSQGAAGGEVRFAALVGSLGYVRNQTVAGKQVVSAGIVLGLSPGQYLAIFECSGLAGLNMSVAVEGAVIGLASPLNKMSPQLTLRYGASFGRQRPLGFEGGATSVLFSSIAGGAPEQTGLTWTNSLTSQESLEIKALP